MNCCDQPTLEARTAPQVKKAIAAALVMNAVMFIVELGVGIAAGSQALLADSLDMLGDAFIYGASLAVIARPALTQAKVSWYKGLVMFGSGAFVLWETVRRALNPSLPAAEVISFVGFAALAVNIASALVIARHRGQSLNMRSAWLCSRNDALNNAGVILAGVLVGWFKSPWPDLAAGFGIAALVFYSSLKIIITSRSHIRALSQGIACAVCRRFYAEKLWAQRCYAWCAANRSANPNIAKHSLTW
jgi:Co/Zn/Cd efflux system component